MSEEPDSAPAKPGPSAPTSARVVLEPRVDLAGAAGLRDALLRLRGRDAAIDARAVDHLGGSGLQVLIAARRAWAQDGRAIAVEAPSDAFVEGLARLGATIDTIIVEAAT